MGEVCVAQQCGAWRFYLCHVRANEAERHALPSLSQDASSSQAHSFRRVPKKVVFQTLLPHKIDGDAGNSEPGSERYRSHRCPCMDVPYRLGEGEINEEGECEHCGRAGIHCADHPSRRCVMEAMVCAL